MEAVTVPMWLCMAIKSALSRRGFDQSAEKYDQRAVLKADCVSDIKKFILTRLLSTATDATKGSVPQDLTIGIEQEFFLLDHDGNPATHESGQRFLAALAKVKDWYVREEVDSVLGKMIERVSLEGTHRKYTVVKYDHHPHLLEIAFAYEENLHILKQLVSRVSDSLKEAAEKSNTVIGVMSQLSLPGDDPRITSPLPAFQKLRHYRAKLYDNKNRERNNHAINYAATIAATQVHIGATHWWQRPSLVEWLYSFEPEILTFYADTSSVDASLRTDSLLRRWEGYADVFAGYPLVGYPRMSNWNIDLWIDALLKSPLAAGPDQEWAGKTLHEIEQSPFSDWGKFFDSVRDLQIIRPKLFGTLEFRADPTQSDLEGVLNSAAMRLGLCAYGISQSELKCSFSEAQKLWWDIVRRSKVPAIGSALDIAEQGLRLRGLGEEVFLTRKFR